MCLISSGGHSTYILKYQVVFFMYPLPFCVYLCLLSLSMYVLRSSHDEAVLSTRRHPQHNQCPCRFFNPRDTSKYELFFFSCFIITFPFRPTITRGRSYPQRASGQAVVTGVYPSPPRYVPSFFAAHRVQHSHRSSIFIECSIANSRSRAFGYQ